MPQSNKDEYFPAEIAEMLKKAHNLGFSLEKGCELEKLTLDQLRKLVNGRPH